MYGKQSFYSKVELTSSFIGFNFMAIPLQWATAQLTLSTTRTNLGTVIKQIQSQSKYQFFYNDKLSATQVEAVNVKDASLEQVLNSLLSGTSISYKVEDNIVYLSEKNAQQTNQQQVGQEHTITGQVIDTKGEMLIGVSILQKEQVMVPLQIWMAIIPSRSAVNNLYWYFPI